MRIFTFLERNELHGVVEMVEDDDVLIHDVIDVGRIILLHGGILNRDVLKISHRIEGGESIESAELLALALYMEGRDEVVDTL